jgi:hypothetical protein
MLINVMTIRHSVLRMFIVDAMTTTEKMPIFLGVFA